MAVGGGLSVLLLNFMYRLSVSSELDREREEQARVYFDEHGDWPEDEPVPSRHKWVLPAGAVTFEQELAQQAADDSICPDGRSSVGPRSALLAILRPVAFTEDSTTTTMACRKSA